MPVYSYSLTTFNEKNSSGFFTADDIETVLRILRDDEVAVLYVEEVIEENNNETDGKS